MQLRAGFVGLSVFSLSLMAAEQPANTRPAQQVELIVPAGAPLRLYLTKRVPKKEGAPVEAKVLDAVSAFDREVIPAGSVLVGHVSGVHSVPGKQRFRAVLGGDFTPLHTAPIEFTTLVLPDGRKMPLHTAAGLALASIVPSRQAKAASSSAAQKTGVLGTGKQKVQEAVQSQIARAKSIPDLVRGPDKKEQLEDYLMAKLPYHPQYERKGTRFDAELLEPLSFGTEAVNPDLLAPPGTQPPADSVGHARLVRALDSASAKPGAPVEAVLEKPVYSADHKLILPAGTRITGAVVEARRARWFHRSGQLRFTFRDIELPAEVARLQATIPAAPAAAEQQPAPAEQQATPKQLKFRTQADLTAAESSGKAQLKVDSEGGVRIKESKTRFLAAAAAVLVTRRSGDLDPVRNQSGQVVGQSQNVGGRTIGGSFGFGLLGAGISQSSRYVGAAFGYYGLAWALYSTVIARGSEVQFRKDAVVDIRFEARPENGSAH